MRVNIPTYLDDFRHGFPSKGLSSLSSKWWGSSLPDEIVADKVHEDTKMDISSDDIKNLKLTKRIEVVGQKLVRR